MKTKHLYHRDFLARSLTLVAGLWIGFWGFSKLEAKEMLVDRIAAVVDKEVITESDIRAFRNHFQKRRQIDPLVALSLKDQKSITRDKIIEVLIRQKIIENHLTQKNQWPEDNTVDRQIEQIRLANNMSQRDLESTLAQEGYRYNDYYEDMRSSVATNRVIEGEIRPKIQISDQDVKNEYFSQYVGKSLPVQYKVRHLFFDPSQYKSEAAAREFAERVRNRILAGESFAELARNYSQGPAAQEGGDLGFLDLSHLSKALSGAAEGLKIGELSSVIESSNGFHLIRMEDKRTAEPSDYEERKTQIKNSIYQTRLMQSFEEWIEAKKSESYVRIIPVE
jgi:peptidyl-prolyl cis-trans isomerase SurA